jgi:uncharacterized damage-inducible protein DinB
MAEAGDDEMLLDDNRGAAMPTTPERYRRWFEYEKDSHAKILAALNAVPEPQRSSEAYERAVSLMAHLVLARWLWLFRFGVGPRERVPQTAAEFFPRNVSMAELPGRVAEMEAAWESYLARMDEAEVSRVVQYQSLDAGGFRNTVEDVLTQLFGHSWYHRGQIAQLLRSIGAEPPVTDFIFWSREAI